MAAIGIWPRFRGRATHDDRWASYDAYQACKHSWCGAHLLRELTFLAEEHAQAWAGEMRDLLLGMHQAAQQWRALASCSYRLRSTRSGSRNITPCWPRAMRPNRRRRNPPPPTSGEPRGRCRRGRPKQSPAKNLLDALLGQAERVLGFLSDLRVPFTNNQAERDLRMAKVQQKISGTFRSAAGATAFCRLRSYLSTMRKQGHNMLDALTAVFNGCPLPVAWGS